MDVKKEYFGKVNGKDIYLLTLGNRNGMSITVCNFGALVNKVCVPDRTGNIADVVLGFAKLEQYFDNPNFYGVTVGPSANRINNASYSIDGAVYKLDANFKTMNLHSHMDFGVHKRVWDWETAENSIKFSLKMVDGELGFGGNKEISVTYSLNDENEISITYDVESDKRTLINMTNHSYFNLNGQGNGDIKNHKFQFFSHGYAMVDASGLPTGVIDTVQGTPFDFVDSSTISERLCLDVDQLKLAGGYDHNFVCDYYDSTLKKIAIVTNEDESRTLEVYTDLPGFQFYSGNMLNKEEGKAGAIYGKHSGFALETQYYPDSINKPQFPSPIFGPERPYRTTTVYKFIT